MGVPGFLRWVTRTFPDIKLRYGENVPQCNHLFIDFNSLIYHAISIANQIDDIPSNALADAVMSFVDDLVKFSRPQKTIFISIDGTAPIAKLQQQRSNRFAAIQLSDDSFNTNNITSGTHFMPLLEDLIKQRVVQRKQTNNSWKQCNVFFSDSSIPGEGEHKILKHISSMLQMPEFSRRDSIFIYSPDADLFFLTLGTHYQYLYLIKDSLNQSIQKFDLFFISRFRDGLSGLIGMNQRYPEFERIIDDFIFLSMFGGNDFFPGFKECNIRDDFLNFLIDAYKQTRRVSGEFLINENTKINKEFLITFIKFYLDSFQVFPEEEDCDYENDLEKCKETMIILSWTQQYYKCYNVDNTLIYHFDSAPSLYSFLNNLPMISFPVLEEPNSQTKKEEFPVLFHLMLLLPPQSNMLLPEELREIIFREENQKYFPKDPIIVGDSFIKKAKTPIPDIDKLFQDYKEVKLSKDSEKMNEIGKLLMIPPNENEFIIPHIPSFLPFSSILNSEAAVIKIEKTQKKGLNITISNEGISIEKSKNTEVITIERPNK